MEPSWQSRGCIVRGIHQTRCPETNFQQSGFLAQRRTENRNNNREDTFNAVQLIATIRGNDLVTGCREIRENSTNSMVKMVFREQKI
jgi:hypothetical protein